MKNYCLISVLFCIISGLALSQDTINTSFAEKEKQVLDSIKSLETKKAPRKEARIGVIGEHSTSPDFFNTAIGLNLKFPVGKHVALDYHYTFGWANEGSFFMHYPAVFGLGLRGMASVKNEDNQVANTIRFMLFLLCLVPEGLSYRIDASEKIQIVPYLHPLGEDYRKNSDVFGEEIRTVAEIGSRVTFKLGKRLYAMPHAGVKIYYHTFSMGGEGGITLGLRVAD